MNTFVFLFLLSKVAAVFGAVMCPYLSLWEAHSKMFCKGKPTWYHCLENQAGDLRETCLEPVYINRGYYPVLSIDLTFIKPIKCPPTHYQSEGQMSNNYKSITCMYPKSLCDDDGEETCDDGSNTKDRMCRCDYTRGYRSNAYLLSNPKNASCYQSKSEEEGCIMFGCPDGQELNPAYYCVKKCSYGYYRRKHEFNCVKNFSIPSSTIQSTTQSSETAKDLTQKPKTNEIPDNLMVVSNENHFLIAAAIASPILTIVIVVVLIFVIYQSRKKGWCSFFNGSGKTVQETEMPRISLHEDQCKEREKYSAVHVTAETYIGSITINKVGNMMVGSNNRMAIRKTSSDSSDEQ